MKKVIVVSDWANDSLYFQSFCSALSGHVGTPAQLRVYANPVSDSDLHSAFILRQTCYFEREFGIPHETVILQDLNVTHNFDSIVVLRLRSGIIVLSTNIGNSLSLVKQDIEVMMNYSEIEHATFPSPFVMLGKTISHFVDYKEEDLELDEVPTHTIPETQKQFVGHVDYAGNIILSLTHEDLKGRYEFTEEIPILAGQTKVRATYLSRFRQSEKPLLLESTFGPPHNRYLMICGLNQHNILPADPVAVG